ncbi:MAG: heat-inducible transcriptional repressor HrcA [Anaerolineae bacterium]
MTIDDSHLPELTRRQEDILSLIIRVYTENPEPVSSKILAENTELNVSSATVRNEMAVLEELGYISAPHTSAGRIPTDSGYRYFVKRVINAVDLPRAEQTRIAERFQESPLATEQWIRRAATILARTVNTAALVTPPIAETSRFKHLEVISIQGRLVLLVLVLHGGAVHQHMFNLTDPIPQAQLSEIAGRINALFMDSSVNQVRMKSIQLQMLDREIADMVADLMEKADSNPLRLIYRDGLSEVISSFQNNEGVQQAVRIFEERAFLSMILNELSPIVNHVQVLIGGEGRWDELKHISIVFSRYGIPGQVSGAVGVLGPISINYGRAISTVRFVSGLMTDALENVYETPDDSKNKSS